MTDTELTDAVAFPEDEGTGIPSGQADYSSAGYFGLLSSQVDDTYVGSGFGFTNVDTTNETVDISPGHLFVEVSNVSVQSADNTTYDTPVPDPITSVIILPTTHTISLDTDAVNDIYVYFDTSQQDAVYVRHGAAVSAPSEPHLYLGTVDTTDGSTTRANDYPSSEFDTLTVTGSTSGIDHADLTNVGENQHHSKDHDHSEADVSTVPNTGLTNDTVTVAGNAVSLGGTTTVDHADLSNIGASDHHTRYSNEEAQDAVGAILSTDFTYDDAGNVINMDPHVSTSDAHHSRYTDTESVSAAEAEDPFTHAGKVEVPSGDIELGEDHFLTPYPTDTFTYGDFTQAIPHYAVGWHDSTDDASANAEAFLTGYGGVRVFSAGAEALTVTGGQNVEIPNGDLAFSSTDYTQIANVNDIEPEAGRKLHLKTADEANAVVDLYDTYNSRRILIGREGGNVEIPHGSVTQGNDPRDAITETTSPKSFNFDGSRDRDIHDTTNVSISNSSGASATEDITVELYDGVDTTGTLLASETKSVTLANGASTTESFISGDVALDTGTYHIEITQSGTALSVDQTDEYTKGATFTLAQNDSGLGRIENQDGRNVIELNPITDNVEIPNGNLSLPDDRDVRFGTGDNFGMRYDATNTRLELTYDPEGAATDLMRFSDSGVYLPHRDLYLNDQNIRRVESVRFSGDGSYDSLYLGATTPLRVYSADNSQVVQWFYHNGDVEIPNGNLNLGTNEISAIGGLTASDGTLNVRTDSSGSGTVTIQDAANNNATIAEFNEGGDVEIPWGSLIGGNASLTWQASDFETNATSAGTNFLWYDNDGTQVLAAREGGNVEVPNGSITQGRDPQDTITETTSPKSFNFDGSTERDIHVSTDVTISNSSGASATEDITVELYDGVDTTGTLLQSETQSITLADAASTTATFITTNEKLDSGTYHIEITQSGTALSIDQTDEHTHGATYTLQQTVDGIGSITDHLGRDVLKFEPDYPSVSTPHNLLAGPVDEDEAINDIGLGIGGGEEAGQVIASGSGKASNFISIVAHDNAVARPGFFGYRSRGTTDTLDPVQDGDRLLMATGIARNGNGGWTQAADMRIDAGTPQGTNNEIVPGEIRFRTRGTDDSYVTRTLIRSDGVVETRDGVEVTGGVLDILGNMMLLNDGRGVTHEFTRGNSYDTADGVMVRTRSNPTSGNAIFRVLSSGGSERLRVEHAGTTSTSNNRFEIAGNPAVVSSTGTAYDIQKNGTDGTGVINFKT